MSATKTAEDLTRAMLGAETTRGRRTRENARARTVSIKRLSVRELRRLAEIYPEQPGVDYERPKTYGECESEGLGAERPCPFVSCRYHLALDVSLDTGSIKHNFPDREVWEMEHTCALHIAAQGGTILEDVGEVMNITRERVRQLEASALAKLKAYTPESVREYLAEGPPETFRAPVRVHLPIAYAEPLRRSTTVVRPDSQSTTRLFARKVA